MDDIFDYFHMAGPILSDSVTENAAASARTARSEADRATERAIEAEFEVERLRLVTQAMWEFLKEQHAITDADLEARIQEIDLRDGKVDGKMSRQIAICGKCHRKTGVRVHRRCFYCGSRLEKQHIVER